MKIVKILRTMSKLLYCLNYALIAQIMTLGNQDVDKRDDIQIAT